MTLAQRKEGQDRQKMIRRSNERLAMLDDMGRQRQIKMHEDLYRLEAEKQAEISRQMKLTYKKFKLETPQTIKA